MNETIINIERAILSSIFMSPSNYEDIASLITHKDFVLPIHAKIFELMGECEKLQLPIDEKIILQRAQGKLKESDIAEIHAISPIVNLSAYAQEIKKSSLKRALGELANLLREQSTNTAIGVEEIINTIESRVNDIAIGNITGKGFEDSKQIAQKTIQSLEELKSRGNALAGISTGFSELNHITTGLNKGDLIIIGARPSMGKTSLALNITQNILDSGVGVAIFSLEMPSTQLMLRMLSSLSGIPMQILRDARLEDYQWEKLSQVSNKISAQPLFINDESNLSIALLRSKLRALKKQYKDVGVAIIDYLQLMQGDRSLGKNVEISDISRGLKTLARELEMPIIALSQLNRSVEGRDDKRPILSDLRDSGAIEQDADMIFFLYRDDVYKRREDKERLARLKKEGKDKDFKPEYEEREIEPAEIIVAKNRNGETKTVHIQFRKKFMRFENPEEPLDSNYQPTKMEYPSSQYEPSLAKDELMKTIKNL